MMLRSAAAATIVLLWTGVLVLAAQPARGTRLPTAEESAASRIAAAEALVESDTELANHLGLFKSRPIDAWSYGKLVAAANIVTTISGIRTSPEGLNALASKEGLYSENAYGARIVLDGKAMCRLLSIATKGKYVVSLAHRVVGDVPNDEAMEAEASTDLFVTLAYLDRVPMIEAGLSWSPAGEIQRVRVTNPLASSGGPVPYKARGEYDPSAFDAWEFYRFKKSIK